jgi:transcriptional regulator with XRE-family HTH domain
MENITVHTLEEFGLAIRKVRKSLAGLRQIEAAHLIGISPPVLNKLEQGKEVWLSKALEVCQALGIEIVLHLPESHEGPQS